MPTTKTAWDFIGFDSYDEDGRIGHLRIVGGRTLYEAATFYDDTPGEKVKLSRIDTSRGLRQVDRWIDPDTPVEFIPDKD